MDHIQIYLKKKNTPKPNRKHEAGVWAGVEMPAERMVRAHNKRPFFPLRQCPLVSRGGISAEGRPVWLPKETGCLPQIPRALLLIVEPCEEEAPVGGWRDPSVRAPSSFIALGRDQDVRGGPGNLHV